MFYLGEGEHKLEEKDILIRKIVVAIYELGTTHIQMVCVVIYIIIMNTYEYLC